MNKIYIVMPAYNEEDNIKETVLEWLSVVKKIGLEARLIVFDDGSTDDTFYILNELNGEYDQLECIRKENTGHGSTCYLAYKYCIKKGADYIFQTDSDGQTNPDEFWDFYKQTGKADFVIGYRNTRQDGVGRKFISWVLRTLIFIVFKVDVLDANTPFRLMKSNELKRILEQIEPDSFLVNALISIAVLKNKENQVWLPISFKPRQKGKSTINKTRIAGIGFKAIKEFYQFKKHYRK